MSENMRLDKQRATNRLRRALRELEELEPDINNTAYFQWRRDTLVAVSYVFGNDAPHYKEFDELRFYPMFVDSNEQYLAAAFEHARLQAKALLNSMVREIEEYWDGDPSFELPPTMTPPSSFDRVKLLKDMAATFNISDVEVICFDLGIDYDDLKGEEKSAKMRSLILLCESHGTTGQLLELCKAKRPRLNW